jgi:hypothetical protein
VDGVHLPVVRRRWLALRPPGLAVMSETPDELRAPLNALVAKATKGPWETYFTVHGDPYIIEGGKPFPQYILATIATSPDDYGRANTQLIVALVNAWPTIDALLARLATAEAVPWWPTTRST